MREETRTTSIIKRKIISPEVGTGTVSKLKVWKEVEEIKAATRDMTQLMEELYDLGITCYTNTKVEIRKKIKDRKQIIKGLKKKQRNQKKVRKKKDQKKNTPRMGQTEIQNIMKKKLIHVKYAEIIKRQQKKQR